MEIPMIEDPQEVDVQLESVALKGPKVLLERLVKWDLLEHVVIILLLYLLYFILEMGYS